MFCVKVYFVGRSRENSVGTVVRSPIATGLVFQLLDRSIGRNVIVRRYRVRSQQNSFFGQSFLVGKKPDTCSQTELGWSLARSGLVLRLSEDRIRLDL